jgi:hypothetical protein
VFYDINDLSPAGMRIEWFGFFSPFAASKEKTPELAVDMPGFNAP